MRLIVVSLIGVPASGKTTFAHNLVEMSKEESLPVGVITISFDDNVKMDFSDIAEGDYKRQREELLLKIEELIHGVNINRWSEIQGLKFNHNMKLHQPILIVIDDNMFYRSMRQRVRAMCRKLQCDHFQIFLDTPLAIAVRRNINRDLSVPESIVVKMFNQLETPTNPRTIKISGNIKNDDLLLMLNDRIANPEKLEEPTEQQKIQQLQSLIHEMDLITRKELRVKIQSLKTKENLATTCATLNQKRKEFLDNLRSQNLENSADLDLLRKAFHRYLDE